MTSVHRQGTPREHRFWRAGAAGRAWVKESTNEDKLVITVAIDIGGTFTDLMGAGGPSFGLSGAVLRCVLFLRVR